MRTGLKEFSYKYNCGPVENPAALANIVEGNCRTALQEYFYKVRNLFLHPEQILLPQAYKNTGIFIFESEPIDYTVLQPGDILYAENLRKKTGELFNRAFADEEERILHFHTAIYDGADQIWHATAIEGKTSWWNLEKFLYYYRVAAVKRILL